MKFILRNGCVYLMVSVDNRNKKSLEKYIAFKYHENYNLRGIMRHGYHVDMIYNVEEQTIENDDEKTMWKIKDIDKMQNPHLKANLKHLVWNVDTYLSIIKFLEDAME